jgi:regulator of RNase E activity RraA
LVIDRCGEHRHAALGAVLCRAVEQAGAVGVIIDGRACDLTDIARQGMPLWCLGPSPVLGRRQGVEGGVNITIDCGGVAVRPGDAILADDSGILVIPPGEITALVAEGLKRQEREVEILARMSTGERLTDIAGLPRFAEHVRSG